MCTGVCVCCNNEQKMLAVSFAHHQVGDLWSEWFKPKSKPRQNCRTAKPECKQLRTNLGDAIMLFGVHKTVAQTAMWTTHSLRVINLATFAVVKIRFQPVTSPKPLNDRWDSRKKNRWSFCACFVSRMQNMFYSLFLHACGCELFEICPTAVMKLTRRQDEMHNKTKNPNPN